MTLEERLSRINADVLLMIVRHCEPKYRGNLRKAECIAFLKEFILHHKKQFVELLDANGRLLLAELAWNKEVPTVQQMEAKYGISKLPSLPQLYGTNHERDPNFPIVLLYDRCSYDRDSYEIAECEIEGFREYVPEPPKPVVKTLASPADALSEPAELLVFCGEQTAIAEAQRVLTVLQAKKLRVGKQRRPAESTTRVVNDLLLQPDFFAVQSVEMKKSEDPKSDPGPVRAHAWPVLLQQMKFLRVRSECLVLTETGREFLKNPTVENYLRAVAEVEFDDDFAELNRILAIRGQIGNAKRYLVAPGTFRNAVFDGLRELPKGEWISFDEFFRFLRALGGLPPVLHSSGYGLYIGDREAGRISNSWVLQKPYVRAVVIETAATLGLVDLAYQHPEGLWKDFDSLDICVDRFEVGEFLSRYDGLTAIRLNPFGAYLLQVETTYTPQKPRDAHASLKVLPNLEIVLHGKSGAFLENYLQLMAVRSAEHVWKLDVGTVIRSAASGTSLEMLQDFLIEQNKAPLPQPVEEWWSQLSERAAVCVGVEAAKIVLWRDETGALTLANSAGIGRLCEHIGGNRLLVKEKNWNAFVREAANLGYQIPDVPL